MITEPQVCKPAHKQAEPDVVAEIKIAAKADTAPLAIFVLVGGAFHLPGTFHLPVCRTFSCSVSIIDEVKASCSWCVEGLRRSTV